ncbi:copper chaperone PCu(A)C [Leucobacter sp. W1153]|uniref:copper chaperone PCu(A)C n=1 Tax=unclassified Leucobacter TaxID=2621730 RepID=UPI003F322636
MRKFFVFSSTAALLIAAPLLTGCATGATPAAEVATTSEAASASEQSVTLVDGWAKAGEGMTGLFGTLTNLGETDLVITGVVSPAAGMVELHEVTADGVMQEIQGDVVVPAGGTLELMPGGNHIMLMQMPAPLLAGEDVEVTLTFDDGSSVTLTALVKEYGGANEEYSAGHGEHSESAEDSHGMSDTEHAAH